MRPVLTLKSCIKQNFDTGNCSLCFQGHLNAFGSCSPFSISNEEDALCMVSESVVRTSCLLCSQNSTRRSSSCRSLSDSLRIENCFHHLEDTTSILCSHCSNGFPSSDLSSCSEWSEYTGGANLTNCEISTRPGKSSSVHCYRCKQGFSYDLTTKICVTAPIQGCWETNNGKCQSCEAWNGWFSERGNSTLTRGIKCIKEEDHKIDLIVVPEPELEGTKVQVLNKTEDFLNASKRNGIQHPYKAFKEFKDGYLLIDQSGFSKKRVKGRDYFEALIYGDEKHPMASHAEEETLSSHGIQSLKFFHPDKKETLSCFFFSSFCATVYTPYNASTRKTENERVFVFDAKNSLFNGDVYFNSFTEKGKSITALLPITKSSYLVLGFSSDKRWPIEHSTMTLRIDYLNTVNQFGYELPKKAKIMTNYFLYYIEYSKYFLAGFTGGNGVVAYDLTKSATLPAKQFNDDTAGKEDKIAYLEGSRVLLISPEKTRRIYGYGFFNSKKIYHITGLGKIKQMVAIKSSDFYAVISDRTEHQIEFYNLGLLVLTTKIKPSQLHEIEFSQFIGHLLIPEANLVLKYTKTPETVSPSCESEEYTKFSFTNKECSKCSKRATLTKNEVCELNYESFNLPYLTSRIPIQLPTNIKGETHKLQNSNSEEEEKEDKFDFIRILMSIVILALFVLVVV